MSKDWFNIRIKTERNQFNAVRSKILGWPEEVAQEVYWPQLENIAANGAEFIRYIILESTTPTGAERARQGGSGPGRVETGKMYDNVGYVARKRVKGFSLFVGWTRGVPGYSIFQEQGTNNGVKGMHALQQAQEYMLSQLRAMRAGTYIGVDTSFQEVDD